MDTSDSSPPNISVSPSEVHFLKNLLDGEVQRHRALVELSNLTETTQKDLMSRGLPLVEKLNEYPASGVDLQNLVSYPPKIEPVPVKPLFFDAAWNYIEYPGRGIDKGAVSARSPSVTSEKVAEQTTQQKKGWFGFGR